MSSCSLDHWRNVFRSTERSIFEVIEMSIAVAAADRPDELVRRRDGIVMSLYSFPSVVAAAAANGRPEEAEQQQPAADATSYCCSSGGGSSQKSSPEEAMADELQDALDDAFALLDDVLRLKKILDDENEEVRTYVRARVRITMHACTFLRRSFNEFLRSFKLMFLAWGS